MICTRAELLTAMGIVSTVTESELAALNFAHGRAEWLVKTYLQNDVEYAQHVEYLPIRDRLSDRNVLVDAQIRGNVATFIPGTTNNRILQLKHTPVWRYGLEVREDSGAYGNQASGAFSSATILNVGVDYFLDVGEQIGFGASGLVDISKTGHLVRIGNWSIMPKSIKVTYYGGWNSDHLSTVASPIRDAVILAVTKALAQVKVWKGGRGPIVSESLGKTSRTYSEAAILQLTGLMSRLPLEAIQLLQEFRNYGRFI